MHHTYSRIDFFLIQHKDLTLVASFQIDFISFSDHAPIHLTLLWGDTSLNPPTWILNESLLQIPEVHSELDNVLSDYFLETVNLSLNPATTWEVHKCMV